MKCVYVAGAYSAPDVISVFDNMRRGMRLSLEVLKRGYAPWVPWFDYHFALMGEMSLQEYYDYSMAWLERSDAVLVVENSGHSKGVQAEVERAKQIGIPVYYDINDLEAVDEDRGALLSEQVRTGGPGNDRAPNNTEAGKKKRVPTEQAEAGDGAT